MYHIVEHEYDHFKYFGRVLKELIHKTKHIKKYYRYACGNSEIGIPGEWRCWTRIAYDGFPIYWVIHRFISD